MINIGKEVFDKEIEELKKIKKRIDNNFNEAIEIIDEAKGKVIILGIGKSGIIGKKIAATMSSTGTNAIFINAAEGLHGDLGMISKEDVCILISNSGSSEEVVNLIPTLKKLENKLIAMTGNINSILAKECNVVLDIRVDKEADTLNLAPTSSTTATLVMGDALSVALMSKKNFKPNNFALYHPGGALGRRLLTKVSDKMVSLEEMTIVEKDITLLELITNHRMKNGIAIIYEENVDNVVGVITDGDIRRRIKENYKDIFEMKLEEIMTKKFNKIVNKDIQLIDVLPIFEEKKISSCPVFENNKLMGLIKLNDIYSVIN